MTKLKLHLQQIILTCAFSLVFLGSTGYPLQVWAQSARRTNNISSSVRVRFIPPLLSNEEEPDFSDVGRPQKREGGGSRGGCLVKDKPPLTALVPQSSLESHPEQPLPIATIPHSRSQGVLDPNENRYNMGLTVTNPTFWFYVPYPLTPEHSVEFVLKVGKNDVYKTKFPGLGTPPGIVSLRLPSTASLEANKSYNWYLFVYCDSQNKDKFDFVNGLVRRVERPKLKSQLYSATPQERIIMYATEGIWYDALTGLAELHRAYPKNDKLNQDWVGLLQSVGLEKLAPEPFVPCCSPLN